MMRKMKACLSGLSWLKAWAAWQESRRSKNPQQASTKGFGRPA